MTADDHPLSRAYKVATFLAGGEAIVQQTTDLAGEVRQRFLDTQEAQMREKLMELGWFPPDTIQGTARGDMDLYGVAYEVDGKRIHPSRVVVRRRLPVDDPS